MANALRALSSFFRLLRLYANKMLTKYFLSMGFGKKKEFCDLHQTKNFSILSLVPRPFLEGHSREASNLEKGSYSLDYNLDF